ncbi:hypothetical protein ACIA8C_16855 [Nocardia sp. NPDC051321]|uniref:hypothetical protein n=1 Tax=Nocardia sp. NPDC051321 TaxID=3364323 RepID=UPI00379DF160
MTGVEPGTRNRYRRVLINDIEPFFGALSPVSVFCETVIGRWINHLAENVGNAAKTIANKHGVLFRILEKLACRGVIPSNPCEQTELPRVVRAEMNHLEPGEFAALLAALPERWRHPHAQPARRAGAIRGDHGADAVPGLAGVHRPAGLVGHAIGRSGRAGRYRRRKPGFVRFRLIGCAAISFDS